MIDRLRLELRRGRMLVLWVGLVSALYAGVITAFYPTILENAAEFEKMLAIYPKELMAAFGISGNLGDPGTFVNSYVFQFLWPLVAAIVAILLATRLAADAATRLPRPAALDPVASGPLPRRDHRGAGRRPGGPGGVTIGAILLVDLFIEPDFADRAARAGGRACDRPRARDRRA